MSSPPTLPWSARARALRVVVLILYQCAVACPASGPLGGLTVLAAHRVLFRQTALIMRSSPASRVAGLPACGASAGKGTLLLSMSPRTMNWFVKVGVVVGLST